MFFSFQSIFLCGYLIHELAKLTSDYRNKLFMILVELQSGIQTRNNIASDDLGCSQRHDDKVSTCFAEALPVDAVKDGRVHLLLRCVLRWVSKKKN